MLHECRRNKDIKYAIFDEPDRFMRSMTEMGYFIVEFGKLGVEVKFASKPELNTKTAIDTLMLVLEAFKAEGTNESNQRKSIAGLTKALQEGRYPFQPPIGYTHGSKGVHQIDPVMGPIIKNILLKVANHHMSPSDAVREFNESAAIRTGKHCSYKLDKFRLILTNPYHAGIVEMNKQVQCRNEDGLHEAMITKAQHEELLKIVNGKMKTQKGPCKNGHPKYVMNGATCEKCQDSRLGKLVGFDHTNGKTARIYERYRCRNCGAYNHMKDLHQQAKAKLDQLRLSGSVRKRFIEIMGDTWRRQEENNAHEKAAMSKQILELEEQLDSQADRMTDPSNEFIRDRLERTYKHKQAALELLKEKRKNIDKVKSADKERFMQFALGFVDYFGNKYFYDLPMDKREVCKQILFPGGFCVSPAGEVYTPEISPIYRLLANKKGAEAPSKSLMVRVKGL